jgi:hypothetical protein
VHLTAEELDVAVLERVHGAEALGRMLEFEDRDVCRHVKEGV